jgi:uncharacterized protein YjeT (DUF2065 family)
MNWGDLLAALALVLVIEGLLPFISPRSYRNTMQQMLTLPEKTIRMIGLASMVAGLIMLNLVRG